jgi:hypothetical protein
MGKISSSNLLFFMDNYDPGNYLFFIENLDENAISNLTFCCYSRFKLKHGLWLRTSSLGY